MFSRSGVAAQRRIGEVDEHPLAIAQRRDANESPDRLDVAAGLANETPDVSVGELDFDGHGSTSALKLLHQHLFRLLGQRLGHVLDQRPIVDANPCRPRRTFTPEASVVAAAAAPPLVTPYRSTSLHVAQESPPASTGSSRLSALLEPAHHFVDVDLHLYRVGHRIVVPEVLDEPAVSRRPRVRHHQAVKGVLLGPHPPQPYLDQPEPPCPNSRPRPALPPRSPTPNCFASFCIASRAFKTLLTSAG